ncbi:MAG: FAD-binding protein, partial [Gammaproteobacteria bacterium]
GTWLNRNSIYDEIINNPDITHKAKTLRELSEKSGLPYHGVRSAVQIWNRMLTVGDDFQFGRFSTDKKPRGMDPISQPPYFALKVYPLTRKSMGGPATSSRGQVISQSGGVIPGLYAAGELTGVAGINGSHGGSGTFLGPSVLTGRIAGKTAALMSGKTTRLRTQKLQDYPDEIPVYRLPGYWHYDVVHQLASERAQTCDNCHDDSMPMSMADTPAEMIARLDTCTDCH